MSDFRLFSEEEMTGHAARIAQDLFDDLAAGMSRHDALTKMGETSADILVERGSALADRMQQKIPLSWPAERPNRSG